MSLHVGKGEDRNQWVSISRKRALSLFSLYSISLRMSTLIPKARPMSNQSLAALINREKTSCKSSMHNWLSYLSSSSPTNKRQTVVLNQSSIRTVFP